MKAALLALLAILSTFGATDFVQAQNVPKLTGHWTSEAIENYESHFATRTFTFNGKQWSVVYSAYVDGQGKQPLFRLDVGGSYVIGRLSEKLPGTYEAIFMADHRHITATSEDGVQMFAAMGCPLKKDKEVPLVNTGCGFVPGIMQAMGEYDLVSVKDGNLYFGDRAGDLTKMRPQKLTPYPLTMKEN